MQESSLMSPPANGEATITVGNTTVPETTAGEGIAITFDITTVTAAARRKRATATDCTLAATLDGVTVYNETLLDYGGATTSMTSDAVLSSTHPVLQFIETCGDNPAQIIVSNVLLVAAPVTPITSTIVSETATATGTETGTATGTATGTETGTATGTETGTATGTETGTSTGSVTFPTATSTPGFPEVIDNFVFFGCLGSTDNFPTFSLRNSSAEMTLELCTSQCSNATFAGVYET